MHEFQPGETINHRYRVVRKLGAGAMGTVYLCEDSVENNISVALKVLISDNLDDQDAWAKGEYEALTRLRHPNLARVYNFGKIGDSKDYFLVSEFIKGVDLFSATEYASYDELSDILVQTCRALEYIHSRGYIHFDIKPDNVLVTRHKSYGLKEGSKVLQIDHHGGGSSSKSRSRLSAPNVKLIDFGLAERITGSFSFAIKGTLNYLAPEIINGQKPDQRADLYSLGVTLYQIVNRTLPHHFDDDRLEGAHFQTMKRSELFEMHMKNVPEYLRKTVLKLIHEDPAKRFQSAREVIQFLSRESGHQYDVETKETQKSYLHSTRMVGRKKEIHLLKSVAEKIFPAARAAVGEEDGRVVSGSQEDTVERRHREGPAMVMVSGEMGIGKSRLLEEFQHYLRLNDIQVYAGNCYEELNNAYQPFVEILRQIVYSLGLESEIYRRYQSDLLRLLPEMRGKEAGTEGEVGACSDKDKIFFIDRITQFLLDVAEATPYAFIVNNLHWADEVSIELLEALVDRLSEARKTRIPPLMVLASLRIDEQHPEELKTFLTQKKENGVCQDIYLRRLKRSQVVELLRTMLGFTEVPELFLNRLEEKTGGNPLFIQETLKTLQGEGILKNTADGWHIKTTGYNRVEIPSSLEGLLLQRVRRLEPVRQEILEIMSVLNRPVSPKVLQKFKRFASIPILVHLRSLEESGLVTKVFEGGKLTFQIDQPKMREILYTNLEEEKRRQYHGEVGEFFNEAYRGHEEEVLEDLAYHYQRSDQIERAIEMASRAGDRLKAIYANERALEFFLYVIEKTENQPEHTERWRKTHENIGELCTIMGRYDLAEQSYEHLLHGSESHSVEPADIGRYHRKKGRISEIQGDYDTSLRCYKEARGHLADVKSAEATEEHIRILNCIGWIYVCMGKYEKALNISAEALRAIDGSHNDVEYAMVYNVLGSANYFKGNFRQAVDFQSRSLRIQENLENTPEITSCLNNLGRAYMANADYAEALEHFQRALHNSEEIGDPYGRGKSLHNFGSLYYELGRLEQAEAYVSDSLQLSRSYNMRFLNIENYTLYGKIKRGNRDYSRAESHLFRALTAYSKQGNRWGLCTVLLEIVSIHRLRGNAKEALTMVDEAYRYATDMDIALLKSRCLLEKGRVLRDAKRQETPRILELFELALVGTDKLENPELRAEIHREIGDLLVRDRRLDEAKARYRKAEELLRQVVERLPPDLQEYYRQKHRKYFQLDDSVVFVGSSRGVAEPDKTPPSGVKTPGAPADPGGGLPGNVKERLAGVHAMESMNELMQALQDAHSLSGFLKFTLRRLLDLSRARGAFVLQNLGDRLAIRASANARSSQVIDGEKLIVLPLVQKVFNTQRPIAISDLVRDPHLGDLGSLIKGGYRSLLILPYQSPAESGVIYLLDPLPREGKLEDDLVFYNFFANLISLAIMQLESVRVVEVSEVAD